MKRICFLSKLMFSNGNQLTNIDSSDYINSITANPLAVADKSIFIEKILKNKSIYLITRPRRMGKTFNLSMLKTFLDIKYKDHAAQYFKDTYIMTQSNLCSLHMNKYPVISLSLKGNINIIHVFII